MLGICVGVMIRLVTGVLTFCDVITTLNRVGDEMAISFDAGIAFLI